MNREYAEIDQEIALRCRRSAQAIRTRAIVTDAYCASVQSKGPRHPDSEDLAQVCDGLGEWIDDGMELPAEIAQEMARVLEASR